MQLIFHRFDLHLKHTFTIAHDSREVQKTLIVELRDGSFSGYGEATASRYYDATVEQMVQRLERVREQVTTYQWGSPEELWEHVFPDLKDHPFALCALDVAAHDLFARKRGIPLYRYWNLSPATIPATNYTIGIDSLDVMVDKLRAFPWPLYKIKLGTSEDLAIVRALRNYTDAVFRVDANGAWTADETIENSIILQKLGVEFIEQPLPASDREGMIEVYKKSRLPVIADESCISREDVSGCQGLFHGVNVKLMKCGGLTPAKRMIEEAKSLGLKAMVGCMTESSVGIAAIAQLLPLLDYVDMDGSLLIANDPADGVVFDKTGRFVYQARPGTGVSLRVSC